MRQNRWMAISGACGFAFFLIANLTTVFHRSSIIAGFAQLSVNTFVFIVWGRAFLSSTGARRLFALIGTVVPVVMASITIWRVLLPLFVAAIYK